MKHTWKWNEIPYENSMIKLSWSFPKLCNFMIILSWNFHGLWKLHVNIITEFSKDVKMPWKSHHGAFIAYQYLMIILSWSFHNVFHCIFICISLLISSEIVHESHFIGNTYENLTFHKFWKKFKMFSSNFMTQMIKNLE